MRLSAGAGLGGDAGQEAGLVDLEALVRAFHDALGLVVALDVEHEAPPVDLSERGADRLHVGAAAGRQMKRHGLQHQRRVIRRMVQYDVFDLKEIHESHRKAPTRRNAPGPLRGKALDTRKRGLMFERVAIIGLGLIGGSIGLAVAEHLPGVVTTGFDIDPAVRRRAAERGLTATVCDTAAETVADADLVILCVPVGAMGEVARQIAPALSSSALVSDVGSSKRTITRALADALPGQPIVPAHPVAGV